MKLITPEQLADLQDGAEILSLRRGRPKVFQRPDGLIYKLFPDSLHWKRSGPVRPARRFAYNTRRLAARGIACPRIVDVFHVDTTDRDLVVYEPLGGETLRDVLPSAPDPMPLRRQLAMYIARLHGLGIYFAAGHLGNYVLRPNGELGLIDVQDLSISVGRLWTVRRARSFRILLKYPADQELLGGETHLHEFLTAYAEASALGPIGRRLFYRALPGCVASIAQGAPSAT